MTSGVYAIINIQNNHIYVGSALNIGIRWERHKKSLCKGVHHSIYLQRAWDKYGENNFICIPVFICTHNRIEVEQQFIDNLHPEYNMAIKANGGSYPGVHKGIKRPDIILRNKLHKTRGHTGKPHSTEAKEKMSKAWEARKLRGTSDETRKRMSIASKQRRHTEDAKKRISEAIKEHWKVRKSK
jgi:group I intron endonuclease